MLAGCGGRLHAGPAPTDRPIGEDLLALLPAGNEAVIDVDVAQLDGWPTARRLLALVPAEGRVRFARIAEDPLAAVEALAVGVSQIGAGTAEVTTVVRGELDWPRLAHDAAADYHGAAIVDDEAESVARIAPKVFAFGSRASVRRVCDVAAKNDESLRASALDARLRAALGHAPTAKLGRPALMAALLPSEALKKILRDEKWFTTGDLDWLALAFAVGDGFDVGVVAGARGAEEAMDMGKAMLARAKDARGQTTVRLLGLAPYIDPFTVAVRGNEVHVAYRLGGARVDRLVTRLEELLQPRRKVATP